MTLLSCRNSFCESGVSFRTVAGWEFGGLAQFGVDSAGVRGGNASERFIPPCFASYRWENNFVQVEAERSRNTHGKLLVPAPFSMV